MLFDGRGSAFGNLFLLGSQFPLTPALSPRRGWIVLSQSTNPTVPQCSRARLGFPLSLGERAGVRGTGRSNAESVQQRICIPLRPNTSLTKRHSPVGAGRGTRFARPYGQARANRNAVVQQSRGWTEGTNLGGGDGAAPNPNGVVAGGGRRRAVSFLAARNPPA